jgi:hypothetical protein
MRQGWEYACGAYLCLDGRCRSCTSDADCRVRQRVVTKEDAETTCEHVPDFAGKTCGRYDLARREGRLPALPPPGPYLTPAQTQVQPNSSVADGGIQDKLPHGTACVRDRACRSGFCDAGICVHLYGKGNYGRDCEPLPPVVAPEPGADGPMPAEIIGRALREDGCGGYLCIDRRCRSCAQDSECRDALGSPACVEVAEYLGRSCAGLFHPPRSGGGPPPLLAPGPPR